MSLFEKAKKKVIKDGMQLLYSLKNGVWIDEVVTIGEIETSSPVLKDERYELLHKYFTPHTVQLGLTYVRDNVWLSEENKDGIRKMIRYDYNGTDRATIAWGVCLTFLPLTSGTRLIYQRTNSNSKLHLFEFADEFKYLSNVNLLENPKGGIYHQKHRFESDLKRVINEEIPNILAWFERADTIEGLIEIANEQIINKWLYHYPSQYYVLAFLYAKNKDKDKAFEFIERYFKNVNDQEHYDKVSQKLLNLINK